MEDSVFTKIIRGEIPCHKIYEDDDTIAFLDIHPSTPGHVLVVPKKQVAYLWEMDEKDYQTLMLAVRKIGKHVREVLKPSYLGISVDGSGVPHVHVHIIPFETAKEFHHMTDQTSEPDHLSLEDMAEKLSL